MSLKQPSHSHSLNTKAIANRLCHDEITVILQYLEFKDIASCRLVNSNWRIVSSSDLIWKPLYDHFFMNDFFEWDKQDEETLARDDFLGDEYDDEEQQEENEDKQEEKKESSTNLVKKTFYELFKTDYLDYPNVESSGDSLINKLNNFEDINDVEVLKTLIRHVWNGSNPDSWEKIYDTARMVVDKKSKLLRKEKSMVLLSMILLILFNKKRVDYLLGVVQFENAKAYIGGRLEIPLLAFCKLLTSNRSHSVKFFAEHSITDDELDVTLAVSEDNDNDTCSSSSSDESDEDFNENQKRKKKPKKRVKKSVYKRRKYDCSISTLMGAFECEGVGEYVARQDIPDMMNQDCEKFTSSFFNAGAVLNAFNALRASVIDNTIEFTIHSGASYC